MTWVGIEWVELQKDRDRNDGLNLPLPSPIITPSLHILYTESTTERFELDSSWNVMAQGDAGRVSEGETREWSG